MPYGGMNMNMGGGMNAMSPAMGYGNSGRYGANGGAAASASVLEDQLLGTYGGGINRLQTSSMRHGVGSSYGSVGTPSGQYGSGGGYGGGGGPGYGGNANAGGYGLGAGHGSLDYDDFGGYRSQPTNASGLIGGPAGAGNTGYSAFGAFGNNVDLGDRFATRGPFSPTNMNGFGINGLTPQGSAGGSGGGASPSRYDYGDDGMPSPQFQASDILRQDTSGLAGYLGGGGGAPSASNGTGATGNTGGVKPNGHSHSGPRGAGAGLAVKDGMHEMTGMFGNLAVGGQKTPISPGSATGTSFGTQHGHQHFRGDSGRFS